MNLKKILKNIGFGIACVGVFGVCAAVSFQITKNIKIERPYKYLKVDEDESVWKAVYDLDSDGKESTKFDLYLPANADTSKNYSHIFYIHGGRFAGGCLAMICAYREPDKLPIPVKKDTAAGKNLAAVLVITQYKDYNKNIEYRGGHEMGIYLNPRNNSFAEACESDIYIDKSELIAFTNKKLGKLGKCICVSRPRRFGKSVNMNMLSAFYSRGCDSREMFEKLKIAKMPDWDKHLNKYNVIHINMQRFLSNSHSMDELLDLLKNALFKDFRRAYKKYDDIDYDNGLSFCMDDIYSLENIQFVVLIDEWDCIFREHRDDKKAQEKYLDFIRDWLKDQSYVALAYMTGILPIKKYGTHSALNMFDEYSMVDSGEIAGRTGFTEDEVEALCIKYGMDIEQMRYWYDGYQLNDDVHLYCPRSVVASIDRKRFDNYWSKTETFEALSKYIRFDFDGLNEAVSRLLSGERVAVDIRSFQNDMYSMQTKDDILTLLIHLGYLGYLFDTKEVYIPNKEIFDEFVTAMKFEGKWKNTIEAVEKSRELLALTLAGKSDEVDAHIEEVHRQGCDPKHYNNEQALRYTVLIAYFYAREKYSIFQELPSGNGYADIVFLPNFQNPDGIPILVELKYNKSAKSAIQQIKDRHYPDVLKNYDKILLVGINYDKDSDDKKHECVIEEFVK